MRLFEAAEQAILEPSSVLTVTTVVWGLTLDLTSSLRSDWMSTHDRYRRYRVWSLMAAKASISRFAFSVSLNESSEQSVEPESADKHEELTSKGTNDKGQSSLDFLLILVDDAALHGKPGARLACSSAHHSRCWPRKSRQRPHGGFRFGDNLPDRSIA